MPVMATGLMRTAFKGTIFKDIIRVMARHIRLPPTLLRTGLRKPNPLFKPKPVPKMPREQCPQTPTPA